MHDLMHYLPLEYRRMAVVSAALLVFAAAARAQPPLFDSHARSFPVGNQGTKTYRPSGHALIDLDGDGDLDLVHSMFDGFFPLGSPDFAVLWGNGDGTFAPPVFQPTSGYTSCVCAADFNGDGVADLAFGQNGVQNTGRRVVVTLGSGGGTFGVQRLYASGFGPVDLAAADMDGDGDLDLVTANYGNGADSVSVLYNDGAGGFARHVEFAADARPRFLAVGDLTGDGFPDVAVSGLQGARLRVLHNDGAGGLTLVSRPVFQAGFAAGVALGDVDGDGDLDAVYGTGASQGSWSSITVLHNDGSGALGAPAYWRSAISFGGWGLDVVDVDTDGMPDILACYQGNSIDWVFLRNDGSGGFEAPVEIGSAGEGSLAITAGDVDRDGDLDAVLTNEYGHSVTVHDNVAGTFPVPAAVTVAQLSTDMDVADLDADGDLDVVTVDSTIHMLFNRGDGTFVNRSWAPRQRRFLHVRLRDLNGDGLPDLLMTKNTDSPPYDFYTSINDGTGVFQRLTRWPLGSCGGNDFETLDWDDDGDLDVIVSETLGCPTVNRRRLFLLENTGDGAFRPPVTWENVFYSVRHRVTAADFDNDGRMDFASTASGPGLAMHLGNGDGTFRGPTAIAQEKTPGATWLTNADMDGDGNADLVYATAMEGFWGLDSEVGVFRGRGDGTFEEMPPQFGPYSLQFIPEYGVATLDGDGDGQLDVIVSGISGSEVFFYRGRGDGTLEPARRFGVPGDAWRSRAGDMNGDGRTDLVVLVQGFPPIGNSQIVVLQGHGGETCQPNLGFGGPGTSRLTVCGPVLRPGAAATARLVGAPASATCALALSTSANPTPILGGTLLPIPVLAAPGFMTDPSGSLEIPGIRSAAGPLDLYMQFAILDPTQPLGLQFSNAVLVEFWP